MDSAYPIENAAGNGNSSVVSWLLGFGARPTAKALCDAASAFQSHHPILGTEYPAEQGSLTVSFTASYTDCIKYLLDVDRAIIDTPDANGTTALMNAVWFPEHVKKLLEYSPDIRITDKEGLNAVDHAIKRRCHNSAELLIAAGGAPTSGTCVESPPG